MAISTFETLPSKLQLGVWRPTAIQGALRIPAVTCLVVHLGRPSAKVICGEYLPCRSVCIRERLVPVTGTLPKNAYLPYRDPETLKAFLKIIDEFSYDHSERLGDAFEYLLSVLGSQGDAGQFRTPRHMAFPVNRRKYRTCSIFSPFLPESDIGAIKLFICHYNLTRAAA
jgi:hypothetical protein